VLPNSTSAPAFPRTISLHITGDEKGQAQIFLGRLFQAFGQAGSLDVGGKPEFRIRKAAEDGGGTEMPISRTDTFHSRL
jgi:hypothetical protein